MNSSNLGAGHSKVKKQSVLASRPQEQFLRNTDGLSLSWKGKAHVVPESLQTSLILATMENEDEVSALFLIVLL